MIARSGAGINESFTVRKISYGEGVERVFPVYSPYIAEIEVLRRGKVRRAKLYYLRGRRGKAARIFERTDARARRLNAAWKGFKKPKGEPEDLTQIKGIDADLASRLKQLNCYKLEQIANFSDDDIANLDETLNLNGAHREGGLGRTGAAPRRRGCRRRSAGRGRQEGLTRACVCSVILNPRLLAKVAGAEVRIARRANFTTFPR